MEQFNLGVSNKMLQFKTFNTTASGDALEIKTSDLGDLFVKNDKSDSDHIPIYHAIQFTEVSLGELNLYSSGNISFGGRGILFRGGRWILLIFDYSANFLVY